MDRQHKCEICGKDITPAVAYFSLRFRGGPKCMDCQKEWVKQNNPEELANMINGTLANQTDRPRPSASVKRAGNRPVVKQHV